jgi:hypothetical protein
MEKCKESFQRAKYILANKVCNAGLVLNCNILPTKIMAEFKVHINTLTGKTIPVTVKPNYTVEYVKGIVQQKEGIPIDQQRLIHAGKQLEDNITLESYQVQPYSEISRKKL